MQIDKQHSIPDFKIKTFKDKREANLEISSMKTINWELVDFKLGKLENEHFEYVLLFKKRGKEICD